MTRALVTDLNGTNAKIAIFAASILLSGCIRGTNYSSLCANGEAFRDAEKVISYCNEAISVEPENPHHFNNRGVQYFDLGYLQKAMEDFSQAVELRAIRDSDHADHIYSLALVKYELGDRDSACSLYSRSARLGSKDAAEAFQEAC